MSAFYVGNGKVFWTDGAIKLAEKTTKPGTGTNTPSSDKDSPNDDLPF
jgi:hypothetical protein